LVALVANVVAELVEAGETDPQKIQWEVERATFNYRRRETNRLLNEQAHDRSRRQTNEAVDREESESV
jgi:hypothetical protein